MSLVNKDIGKDNDISKKNEEKKDYSEMTAEEYLMDQVNQGGIF